MSSYYEKMLATGEVKCIDDEVPFEIPQGWEWCRIKHICSMQAGKNISANKIFSDKSDSHPYRCVGGNGLRGYTENFNSHGHYSIIGRQGALCGCVNIEKGKFYATEHAVVVDTYEILSPLFMYYFLMALNLNKYATATAQPGLAVSIVLEVMCPLPPLNEGERIIKKLALLIPLVENYNAIQEKQNALNSSIKERLKKSILQEAIQGKLVPQIAEEGTAQELLEQIKTEKQKLVKEGKLKKSALNDSVIFRGDDNKYYEQIGKKCLDITDEIPFPIPNNWAWSRLSSMCSIVNGFTPLRSESKFWDCGTINWFTVEDIKNQGEMIYFTKQKITDEATSKERIVRAGSVLLCCTASVGQCALAKIDLTTNQQFNALTVKDVNRFILTDNYLFWFAKTLKTTLQRLSGKTTFEFVSVKKVGNILIPIPPFQEQQRIVAQIEKLFEQLR